MRRPTILTLALFLALFVSLIATAGGPKTPQLAYSSALVLGANYSVTDFTPDGNLNKPVWKKAQWTEFDHAMSGSPHYSENLTRVAAVWTARNIYFAFSCKYDSLNVFDGEDTSKERWELWNRDVAEVFLNPQPERMLHYYEFEVAPNNQWLDLEITRGDNPNHDAGWNSGFEHATRIDSNSRTWSAEMRIPLDSMGVAAVKTGTEWRVNFFRAAGAGDDGQRKLLAWSIIPEGSTFHVPQRFGILRFVTSTTPAH